MVTVPTVDDFSDTTVMRVIRKIVNYICNDLVDGINNNDIVSGQFSVQGNQLSGTLTKGDGTTIDIPAATLPSGGGGSDNPYPTAVSMTLSGTTLNFNMTMSSGTPITGSVNLASILEDYVTDAEISPTVTINENVTPPTITVAINGKSSTANLPAGGGNGEWEELSLSTLPTDFKEGDILMILFNSVNFSSSFTDNPSSIDEILTLIFYLNGQGKSRAGMLKAMGASGSSPDWVSFSYRNFNFDLNSIEELNKGNTIVLFASFTSFSLKSSGSTDLNEFTSELITRDTNIPRILKILRKRM